MKKITLLIMFLLTTCFMQAQVVAYSFSQSSGTYTEITGGTLLGTTTSDDQRFVDPATPAGGTVLTGVGLPIGFNFVFNGLTYDRFAINNNGWISFGMSSLGATAVNMNSSSSYVPLGSTVTTVSDDLVARIAGLGRDLQAQTGSSLRYELIGTSPNQTLVIQFKNYKKYGTTGTGDNFDFQIRLHETTNVVDVVFGTMVNNATSSTYEVGLRANPASTAINFNSRTSTTGAWATTTSSVVANGSVFMDAANIPASGLTFSWTPPTCAGSVGLTLNAVSNNSATVTWPVPVSAPSNGYNYLITSTAGTPTSGTATATNTATATGLMANTTYYVYVQSNCGTSTGNWVLNGTFKTLCDEVTAFVQNFDSFPSGTTSLPDCWSKLGTSANVYITTGALAPMSPSNRLYMNVSATTTAYAVMAPVSNLQANTHRLKFKTYATTASKILSVGYFTIPGDITSYVEIDPIQLPSTTLATTQEFTVVPTGIPAGVNQLVFKIDQTTPAATTVYIDDVKWEVNSSCIEPTALTATSITNNGATLGWTNGGPETVWDIQYGLSNFALGSGTIVPGVTTNPHPLTGLMANTNYQFYVRAVCTGPQNSSWSGPFSFKTQCNDVTSYFENFDSYTSGTNSLPDCWSRGGTSTSTYITTGATTPMSAANRLYMFASGTTPTEGYAILPAVSNLQANTHRLKFQAYTTVAGRFIEVGYLTDPSDVSTFIQLQEVYLPSTVIANTQEFIIIPTGIPAGVKHLAIKNPGFPSSTTTVYIDNVGWEAIPACSNPTAVNSSAVTSNSAIIAWTSDASATSWEIEYGTPGFTLGTGTIVPAPTNPFTLTGLMSQTAYQYYVRSICAGPITSTNSLSGTFTTACAAFVPDYTQDFTTFPPTCWNRADAGTLATGPTGTGTGIWFADGFANVGTTGAIKVNLYLPNRIGWMISPIMDLTTGGYRVRYDVAATNYASSTTPAVIGSDDMVDFVMSSDGGATWTSMETFNVANTPTVASTTKVYNIPAITSANVLFAFRADEGPVDDAEDWELFIDNFVVETPPATVPACATNIVGTPDASCGNFPFTITWDATATALGYKLNVGTTSGGTDIANNVDLGLVTSYSYATPNLNTMYYYTITPYNSIGDATGCTEQSLATVATGCYCPSTPTSVDGTGITNVQLGTTDYPISVTAAPYYSNQTATVHNMNQGISNNVQISFNTSFYNYNTYIYVDLNDNYTFEATELLFSGESSSTNPSVYDASFVMPASAPIGNHRMRFITGDYIPVGNEDPCYSASYGFTVDFTINVQVPACSPPAATTTIVPDCSNSQFSVNVNVTSLGSGTPTITNGTTTWPITALGVVSVGPFASGTSQTLIILHGSDTTCNVSLGTLSYQCPPVNDDLCNAIPLALNAATTGTAYSLVGATAQTSEPVPACFNGGIDGSVWFSFVAPTSGSVTVSTDFAGGTLSDGDTEIAVYNGAGVTCSDLTTLGTNVGCDQDSGTTNTTYGSFLTLAGLTSGTTYYVQVDRYGGTSAGTFGIQVNTVLSSDNFDNASFVAYPNPVKDVLNLSYSTEITSVKVINLLGQEVISRKVGNTSTKLDMASLTAGAYIVNVTIGDVVKTIKVIKQ